MSVQRFYSQLVFSHQSEGSTVLWERVEFSGHLPVGIEKNNKSNPELYWPTSPVTAPTQWGCSRKFKIWALQFWASAATYSAPIIRYVKGPSKEWSEVPARERASQFTIKLVFLFQVWFIIRRESWSHAINTPLHCWRTLGSTYADIIAM